VTGVTTVAKLDEVRDAVRTAAAVVAVGGRTHWDVGDPLGRDCVEVRAPAGVVTYDPAELTVTVGAGTTVADLAAVLAESGQECVLDPRDPAEATVGGTVASGLSGPRRLRYGPLRDRVLEVRFVTADGRIVKGGGPTVKNVSGYDLPRLLVGSLGTIGVLVQLILRCQPTAAAAEWTVTDGDPFEVRRRCYQPACIAWDGRSTHVLLEGHPDDIESERRAGDLVAGDKPVWPDGPHRGRISVPPARLRNLGEGLRRIEGLAWRAEVGVGTVHVAAETAPPVAAARDAAHTAGGWLLREAGDGDGFGRALPNRAVMARLKDAFDPADKLSPGRLPL
jgi:glycolate oxidase FAD binding subunit